MGTAVQTPTGAIFKVMLKTMWLDLTSGTIKWKAPVQCISTATIGKEIKLRKRKNDNNANDSIIKNENIFALKLEYKVKIFVCIPIRAPTRLQLACTQLKLVTVFKEKNKKKLQKHSEDTDLRKVKYFKNSWIQS